MVLVANRCDAQRDRQVAVAGEVPGALLEIILTRNQISSRQRAKISPKN
jgi:hypothetical protein